MKKSIVLAGALAFALMSMTTTSLNTFAAEGGGITDVSYNNDGTIPDPEHPGNPEWVVKIPTTIKFTNTQKTADATVELSPTGANSMPTGKTIKVSVKSKNNYVLTTADGADPMAYGLKYGSNTMSQTQTEIGDIAATPKIQGTATLSSSAVASVSGSHTDLLTYTVTTAPSP